MWPKCCKNVATVKTISQRRLKFGAIKEKYLNFFLYVTYLILPYLSTTIFQAYLCTNIDPNNEENNLFMTADMSISCTSSESVIYATFMIFVYPIGIPVIYFAILYRYREMISNRIVDDDDSIMNGHQKVLIGFLFLVFPIEQKLP